jgi:hypothetical protein
MARGSSLDIPGIIKGTGIVGVLFVMGVALYLLNISDFLGMLVIVTAVGFTIIFAALGVLGILKRQGFELA